MKHAALLATALFILAGIPACRKGGRAAIQAACATEIAKLCAGDGDNACGNIRTSVPKGATRVWATMLPEYPVAMVKQLSVSDLLCSFRTTISSGSLAALLGLTFGAPAAEAKH